MFEKLCGFGLEFSFSNFQLLYVAIATLSWISALLFSREYMRHNEHLLRYYIFMLLTFAAVIGVFLSADLMTTFIFFELMSLTSYVLVIHEETPQAMRAGQTYLAVAIMGGMIMLMGLFLLYDIFGTLKFEDLYRLSTSYLEKPRLYVAGGLVLTGFGIKAGVFPLHTWLPKAYSIAPAPVSAILSGILSKTGIFGMILLTCRIFYEDAAWGNALLGLGSITMLFGALAALLSVDLKRTLSYSSISQIGFITIGIAMTCLMGDFNAIAARGTILHMVNHSFIKLLMFLVAGIIYMNVQKLDLNDVKGYGRKKPLLALLFLAGAANISGLPFTSGYASKTLLHEAIVEHVNHGISIGQDISFYSNVEALFLLSGAITLAYMAKLFVCIFVEESTEESVHKIQKTTPENYMKRRSATAIIMPALILVALGLAPNIWMDAIANMTQEFLSPNQLSYPINYYSLTNLSGSFISIFMGIAIYFFFVKQILVRPNSEGGKIYVNLWPPKWDLEDALYRPGLFFLLRISVKFFGIVNSMEIKKGFIRQIEPHEERFTPMDWLKNHPLSHKWRSARDSILEVSQSMSFGLLAAVIGLCAVLIYLL